mmetsp:Transcript_7786/g.24977  ORF Transcript_7786/g.24977 Transcript_7786/m.24977 type:complete len:225 (+) Transcript_7786:542-1216(+)
MLHRVGHVLVDLLLPNELSNASLGGWIKRIRIQSLNLRVAGSPLLPLPCHKRPHLDGQRRKVHRASGTKQLWLRRLQLLHQATVPQNGQRRRLQLGFFGRCQRSGPGRRTAGQRRRKSLLQRGGERSGQRRNVSGRLRWPWRGRRCRFAWRHLLDKQNVVGNRRAGFSDSFAVPDELDGLPPGPRLCLPFCVGPCVNLNAQNVPCIVCKDNRGRHDKGKRRVQQ